MRIAAVTCGPTGDMIEIGQHLRIRYFANQIAEQRGDIAVFIGVALAEVQLRRDGQIPLQRQATADVPNMFVNAKNLLNHNNDRQRAVRILWTGVIGGHVFTLRGDRGFACRDGVFRR
ncbi:hypothetical protein D3C78_1362110 [compost metagenome]